MSRVRERYEGPVRQNVARSVAALHARRARILAAFDDAHVWTSERGRLREWISWADLRRVLVITTSNGPFTCDVFLVFEGDDGGCVVPLEAEGHDAIVERTLKLPGFDHAAFAQAMGCTVDRTFVCWGRARR